MAIFMLMLVSYAYFYQGGGSNQNSRFDLVRAIVEDHSTRIDRFEHNTGDKACRGPMGRCIQARGPWDHYYSDKAPGSSWIAVPVYGVAYLLAGSDKPTSHDLNWWAYLCTVFAVGLPSAIAVSALFWLLGMLGCSRLASAALAIGYGLGTLAFPYATLFYGHQLASALVLIAFAFLVRERQGTALGAYGLVGVGALLGMSVVVEYPSALLLIALLTYALSWMRPFSRLAWLALGIAVPGLCCALYHWMNFGHPFTLPYEFSTKPHRSQGFFMGLGKPDMGVLKELLFGSFRGLLHAAPWLGAAAPGLLLWVRCPGHRAEAGVCVAAIVFFLWLNSSLVDCQGGWAMGPRYLIPALPFLVVLVAGLFTKQSFDGWFGIGGSLVRRISLGLAIVVFALAVRSGYWMLAGTAVFPQVPNKIEKPYAAFIMPKFQRGELALNLYGIDASESRAWNLGKKVFGLPGLTSLLPLFALQFGTLLWLGWTLRRSDPKARRDVGGIGC